MPVGALECRDGHGREVLRAVPVATDRACIHSGDLLFATARAGPSWERGREHSTACEPWQRSPGRAQLDGRPLAGQRRRGAHLVRERNPTSHQLAAERVRSIGRCTVRSDTRIPENPRDLREVEARMGIADYYCAAIEQETHGRAPSNEHAGATGVRVYPLSPRGRVRGVVMQRRATGRFGCGRLEHNRRQRAVADAPRAKSTRSTPANRRGSS